MEAASELALCRPQPEAGPDIIEDGSVAVHQGRIVAVAKREEIRRRFRGQTVIEAKGRLVTPGFVDPHTHLLFAGSREDELELKLEGRSYIEILKAGGGILRTVEQTRKASLEKLVSRALNTLDRMLLHGTTTVEAKSGYGLTLRDEVKSLKAIKELDLQHRVDVVPTFMGAHALPPEFPDTASYTDHIVKEMLPRVAQLRLAKFCDVFCEKDVFSIEDSRRLLSEAKLRSMKPKIHADEFSRLGGAELAAEVRATSADHLIHASEKGLDNMARAGVVAVLMPGTSLVMMSDRYADASGMTSRGIPIALATDFNPNCMLENMQLVIALAVYRLQLKPIQALRAATINSAAALNVSESVGSLETGKKADLLVFEEKSHRFLGYHFGANSVHTVVKDGRIVVEGFKLAG